MSSSSFLFRRIFFCSGSAKNRGIEGSVRKKAGRSWGVGKGCYVGGGRGGGRRHNGSRSLLFSFGISSFFSESSSLFFEVLRGNGEGEEDKLKSAFG